MGEKIMKMSTHKKAKKRMLFLALLLLFIVSFSFVSIFKDWMQIMKNNNRIAYLDKYYASLLLEEESLNSEVTKLHDDDYIARYAREKYMYSLPGEIIIKIDKN